jgi:hypothetical protein
VLSPEFKNKILPVVCRMDFEEYMPGTIFAIQAKGCNAMYDTW